MLIEGVYSPLQDGYSIQFLNPQSYSKSMWLLGATLQEHFSSFVGANMCVLNNAHVKFLIMHTDI